jgi:hypothetical protein
MAKDHPADAGRRASILAWVRVRSPLFWAVVLAALLLAASLIFGWLTPGELKTTLAEVTRKLVEDMHFLLPALVGVLILWHESRLKREIHRRELALNEMKFDEERRTREEHRKLIEQEARSLQGVSAQLGKTIVAQLNANTQWASEALERAKLGPFSKTLFGERVGHFYDEKQFLAENFLPLLLSRCQKIVESGREVYLLIDSGTTLYPLFSKLGPGAIALCNEKQEWIKQVEVVTNNLPGVVALMDTGRLNPMYRFSPLAIRCQLLPGVPLPIYSAVLGEKAETAMKTLKDQADSAKHYFIGLTTGNWIRVRRTGQACPVPLARGEGHLKFKQMLIDCSNEVYVVSPLGKVFVNTSLDDLNNAMGFNKNSSDPDKKPYEEVNIVEEKAKAVKLVYTVRDVGYALSRHSDFVQSVLGGDDADGQQSGSALPGAEHHPLPFTPHAKKWYEQIETEFPHRYTRAAEFRRRFFQVPEKPPEEME